MSEQHTYEIVNRRIWMTLPYGSPYKDRIKAAGAHWDSASKRWWIGTVAKDIVLPIMEEAMGLDTAELVSVDVNLDAAREAGAGIFSEGGSVSKYASYHSQRRSLTMDGIPLASWNGNASDYKNRTGTPVLSDFVVVLEGEIEGIVGGSRRKPDPFITWETGTVVRVEVAKPVADEWVSKGYASEVSKSAA